MAPKLFVVLSAFFLLSTTSFSALAAKKKRSAPTEPGGFNFSSNTRSSNLRVNLLAQGTVEEDWIDSSSKKLQAHIPTARVTLSGQAGRKEATYYGSFDFAGVDGNGSPTFMDLLFDYSFMPSFGVTVGYFKVPFALLSLVNDAEMVFVGESTAVDTTNPGRDVGLDIHGSQLGNRVDYNLFVFNGNGSSFTSANNETNLEPILGGRIAARVIGDAPTFDHIDWQRSGLSYGLGLGFIYDPKTTNTVNTLSNNQTIRIAVDETLRWNGLSLLGSYHFVHNFDTKDSLNGIETLISYLCNNNKWLVAIRGSATMPRKAGPFGTGPGNTYEFGGAVSRFFINRNLSGTADYKAKIRYSGSTRLVDHFVRLQIQVWI